MSVALTRIKSWLKTLKWRDLALGIFLLWCLWRMASLELKTSNLDLVDPEIPLVQDFLKATQTFGNPCPIVISLEGDSPLVLQKTVESLDADLKKIPGVANVMSSVPPALRPMLMAAGAEQDDFFLHDKTQRHFYVFIQLDDPYSRVDQLALTLPKIKNVCDSALKNTKLKWKWTGIPIYAMDDYTLVQKELRTSTFFAMGLVLAVVIIGFKEWKRPLLALIPLICGVLSTLALATLWPGYLTLMSSACLTLLIGMGIDFSIHFLIRIPRSLSEHEQQRQWQPLLRGLLSSTVTSAVVFFLMIFGPFRGFQEFGAICGMGILCMLFFFAYFAPRLFLMKNGPTSNVPIAKSPHAFQDRMSWRQLSLFSSPLAVQLLKGLQGLLIVTLFAIGLVGYCWPLRFDANYANLQPTDSQTVAVERQMQTESPFHSIFALMTVKGLPQTLKVCEALRNNPAMVSEIRSLAEVETLGQRPQMESHWIKALFAEPDIYAIQIFPAVDIWDSEASLKFKTFVQSFGYPVTGMPILGSAMTEWTHEAFQKIGAWAFIAVFLVALLDFRNPLTALLACTPMWISTGILLFGMETLNIPMNPISVMAWPIMFGIAIDNGLHWVHVWLQDGQILDQQRLHKAMILTTLTTAGAFGSMAFSPHRGLASMSSLLAVGMMISLFCTLTILPPLGRLFSRRYFQALFSSSKSVL